MAKGSPKVNAVEAIEMPALETERTDLGGKDTERALVTSPENADFQSRAKQKLGVMVRGSTEQPE